MSSNEGNKETSFSLRTITVTSGESIVKFNYNVGRSEVVLDLLELLLLNLLELGWELGVGIYINQLNK